MKGDSVCFVHKLFKHLPSGVVTMASIVFSPGWFQGVDGLFELFSGVVALLITFASWKAYKLTQEGKFKLFSIAFSFITLSFIARLITALSVLIETAEDTFEPVKHQLNEFETVFSFGRLFYVLLVLAGYLILLVVSMNIRNQRVIALLAILTFILALVAHNSNMWIYTILLTLLFFITIHFYENYQQRKTSSALWCFLAFVLLMAETLLFMAGTLYPALYVAAYVMRLTAYMLMLKVVVKVYQ